MTLPQDKHAEADLVGFLLVNAAELWPQVEHLQPDWFASYAPRLIFKGIRVLVERGEEVSVSSVLQLIGADRAQQIGGAAYLVSLSAGAYRTGSVASLVERLRGAARRRRVAGVSEDYRPRLAAGDATEGVVDEYLDALRVAAEAGARTSLEPLSGYLEGYYQHKMDLCESQHPPGVVTGIPRLDAALGGGVRAGDLAVVVARPSAGKTSYVVGQAVAAARSGHPVGFFSLEMKANEILDRTLARMARINLSRIRFPKSLERGEWERFIEVTQQIEPWPLSISPSGGIDVLELGAQARAWRRGLPADCPIPLLIVDQMSYVTAPGDWGGRDGRRAEIGKILAYLKKLGDREGFGVVMLNQLSREQKEEDRPRLSHAKESGAIEEIADIVIAPWRPFRYDDVTHHTPEGFDDEQAFICLLKQRNGPADVDFPVRFTRQLAAFHPDYK